MTRVDVAALIERTTAARGLPAKVQDPITLARVAGIYRVSGESPAPRASRTGKAANP